VAFRQCVPRRYSVYKQHMTTEPQIFGASPTRSPIWRAVRHGAALRCPSCGLGHLFHAYLKPVAACAHCNASFSHIRADDGPAWLTILIVGHVIVACALFVESLIVWPLWVSMMVFCSLTLAMTLALLPSAKGTFIAAIWSTDAREATAGPTLESQD
jgi:uncharacterized protein (DUF983 family)